MLAREGIAATVAVATTRNLLEMAQREGIIESAEAVWSAGEHPAMKAADLLGIGATVADVFVLTRQAGFPLPRPSPAQERAELAHAIAVLSRDRG